MSSNADIRLRESLQMQTQKTIYIVDRSVVIMTLVNKDN